MKYFLDTEFIENGATIDLISIGIVAEDGREFYRQNSECAFTKASDWVWRNVFPHLEHFDMKGEKSCEGKYQEGSLSNLKHEFCNDPKCPWRYWRKIGKEAADFCDPEKYGEPEFWGYYADYDWVAFCHLFGTMMDLPKGFPMYCRDVKQLADSFGNPELPKLDETGIHNALRDAKETKLRYDWLATRIKQ